MKKKLWLLKQCTYIKIKKNNAMSESCSIPKSFSDTFNTTQYKNEWIYTLCK